MSSLTLAELASQPLHIETESEMSNTSREYSTSMSITPSPSPTAATTSTITATDKRSSCQASSHALSLLVRVAGELSTTEKSYVSSITTLLEHYVTPIRVEKLSSSIGLNDEAKEVWSKCWGALNPIVKLHQEIAKDFSTLVPSAAASPSSPSPVSSALSIVTKTSSIFLKHSHYMKLYTAYVDTYLACLTLVSTAHPNQSNSDKKKWHKWVEDQNQKYGNGQNFQSFLIMPIQRIPRYELLLNKIDEVFSHNTQHLSSEENSDFQSAAALLLKAKTSIHNLNLRLNEWKRESESKQKLCTLNANIKNLPSNYRILESHRRYIMDTSNVSQVFPNPSARKVLHLWLTNDVLILVSQDKCKIKGWIEMGDIISLTTHESSDETNPFQKHMEMVMFPERCLSLETIGTTLSQSQSNNKQAPTSNSKSFTPQTTKTFSARLSQSFSLSAFGSGSGNRRESEIIHQSPTPSTLLHAATVAHLHNTSTASATISNITSNNSSNVSLIIFEFNDSHERNKWSQLITAAVDAIAANKENGIKSPTAVGTAASLPLAALTSVVNTTSSSAITSVNAIEASATNDYPSKRQRISFGSMINGPEVSYSRAPSESFSAQTRTALTSVAAAASVASSNPVTPTKLEETVCASVAGGVSRNSTGTVVIPASQFNSPDSDILPSIPLEESMEYEEDKMQQPQLEKADEEMERDQQESEENQAESVDGVSEEEAAGHASIPVEEDESEPVQEPLQLISPDCTMLGSIPIDSCSDEGPNMCIMSQIAEENESDLKSSRSKRNSGAGTDRSDRSNSTSRDFDAELAREAASMPYTPSVKVVSKQHFSYQSDSPVLTIEEAIEQQTEETIEAVAEQPAPIEVEEQPEFEVAEAAVTVADAAPEPMAVEITQETEPVQPEPISAPVSVAVPSPVCAPAPSIITSPFATPRSLPHQGLPMLDFQTVRSPIPAIPMLDFSSPKPTPTSTAEKQKPTQTRPATARTHSVSKPTPAPIATPQSARKEKSIGMAEEAATNSATRVSGQKRTRVPSKPLVVPVLQKPSSLPVSSPVAPPSGSQSARSERSDSVTSNSSSSNVVSASKRSYLAPTAASTARRNAVSGSTIVPSTSTVSTSKHGTTRRWNPTKKLTTPIASEKSSASIPITSPTLTLTLSTPIVIPPAITIGDGASDTPPQANSPVRLVAENAQQQQPLSPDFQIPLQMRSPNQLSSVLSPSKLQNQHNKQNSTASNVIKSPSTPATAGVNNENSIQSPVEPMKIDLDALLQFVTAGKENLETISTQ